MQYLNTIKGRKPPLTSQFPQPTCFFKSGGDPVYLWLAVECNDDKERGSGCYVLDGQLQHEGGGSPEEERQDWQNSQRAATASCNISYKLTWDTPAAWMQNITTEQRIAFSLEFYHNFVICFKWWKLSAGSSWSSRYKIWSVTIYGGFAGYRRYTDNSTWKIWTVMSTIMQEFIYYARSLLSGLTSSVVPLTLKTVSPVDSGSVSG